MEINSLTKKLDGFLANHGLKTAIVILSEKISCTNCKQRAIRILVAFVLDVAQRSTLSKVVLK